MQRGGDGSDLKSEFQRVALQPLPRNKIELLGRKDMLKQVQFLGFSLLAMGDGVSLIVQQVLNANLRGVDPSSTKRPRRSLDSFPSGNCCQRSHFSWSLMLPHHAGLRD